MEGGGLGARGVWAFFGGGVVAAVGGGVGHGLGLLCCGSVCVGRRKAAQNRQKQERARVVSLFLPPELNELLIPL